MTDIKYLMVLIWIFLVGIMAVIIISTQSVVDNQRVQICLDHPTYKSCPQWQR